jgi:hypothetical protein
LHFGTKVHFHHISVLNGWEERERERIAGIRPRERKCHFFDTGHQNVRFLFQMVPYDEESLTWVFFTLKVPKKTRFEVRKKLVFELILRFWLFFALLKVEDWFKKVNKVISSCLGWEWVENGFLEEKHQLPWFSGHYGG